MKPERHIAGFSIRKEDGTALPLIFEAGVGKARDTVVLKLTGAVPEKASLWYGYGLDPYCNLVDGLDMAVPVFGPIALDEATATAASATANAPQSAPVKVLVITGDHGHAWKDTTRVLSDVLGAGGRFKVDVTTTPSKDLTDDNLAKYDVLLLNYKDTANGPPETHWSDANKQVFLKAVREGKGLVVCSTTPPAPSSSRTGKSSKRRSPAAGGPREITGPSTSSRSRRPTPSTPISEGLPAQFEHTIDELYQNSMILPGSVVLATAYSDPSKPKGTSARMSRSSGSAASARDGFTRT